MTLEDASSYLVMHRRPSTGPTANARSRKCTRLIPYPKFASGTGRDGFGDAALLVLADAVDRPARADRDRRPTGA